MGISFAYTGAGTDDAESSCTIHRALDLGVTLIDTAEVYGPYINEELVGRAIAGRRDQVVLATKLGMVSHTDDGGAHIKVVQEHLGHSSYAITADIYSHVSTDRRREATDHLERAIDWSFHNSDDGPARD